MGVACPATKTQMATTALAESEVVQVIPGNTQFNNWVGLTPINMANP